MSYKDHLRSDSTDRELGEVLRDSPTVLLGVDVGAAHALDTLGIHTVFDLAASSTFGAAATVLRTETEPVAGDGQLPADLFTSPPTGPLGPAEQQVSLLRLVAGADDGGVAEALDVHTIRDLALWPPYLAARDILAGSLGTTPADDDGAPADLLPGSGRYPIERSYYSSFVLADLDDPTDGTRTALEEAEPLDLVSAVSGPGFRRPVRGARLTFAQSWYSQGVALGQLLHSLALAPGESTRVAMIDWSRQQSGTQNDTTGQTEMLVVDTTQKRAMSEVQNAVAAEAQHGFSSAHSNSSQTQGGGSLGFSLGPLTVGGSASNATNTTDSDTATGSSGVRNLAAGMTQQVADSTHQAASSARNMYASVVRELSQSEHENISTRVVGNFNHMHALTMQYYEVVQIYRTSVRLHRFEPCLFVPMKPIDFLAPVVEAGGEAAGDVVIRRYRAALRAAALDAETLTLFDAPQAVAVEIRPNLQRQFPPPTVDAPKPAAGQQAPPVATGGSSGSSATAWLNTVDGNVLEVPADAVLTGIEVTFAVNTVTLSFPPGAPENETGMMLAPNLPDPNHTSISGITPVPLGHLTAISLDTGQSAHTGFVTLYLDNRGLPMQVAMPVVTYGKAATTGEQVMTLRRGDPSQTLKARLAEDPLHYSQVIWRAMDSATVALLLGRYTYAGQPLAQVVDPMPIGVTGNMLIFRMPWEARDLQGLDPNPTGVAADQKWIDWVGRHADYDSTVEDFVPLPSGGVFAEAVLGRSNSAEKLDITRFWNWQDSPIPLQAPDIAAIQSGSRAQQDSTAPSTLAAPVVAFNNPPALPDPAGLSGTLAALGNGAMFRDQSGSEITQALAAAALTGAGQGATAAGQQAVANAAMAAQKEIAMAKIAAGILTGKPDGDSVSAKGAKINEGKSLDERNGAATGSHEAKAADGDASSVLALLGSLAGATSASGAPSSTEDSAPAASSGSASTEATAGE
jgi:hypothetical protein